ncbi:hypothetical protein IKU74_03115 [bacterium]|nr:hypothetical protein [bacterium]
MADPILINSYIKSLGLTGKEAEAKRKELEKLSPDELNLLISGKKVATETNTWSFNGLQTTLNYNGEQFFTNQTSNLGFMGWTPQNTQSTSNIPREYTTFEKKNLQKFIAEFLFNSTQTGLNLISDYNNGIGFISLKNGVNNAKAFFGKETSQELEARLKQENATAQKLLETASHEGKFGVQFERNYKPDINFEKFEKLQQKAQEYEIYTAYQEKYDILKEGIQNLKRIYHKETALKDAKERGQIVPDFKESFEEEFIKLISQFCNGNEDVTNEYIKKVSEGITNKEELNQKFLSCVETLEKDCKKVLDIQLNGKTFDEHTKEFNALCKEATGIENPELYTTSYIENSKTQSLYGEIGVTIATSLLLPGSSLVKTATQNLATKLGATAQIVKAGKTVSMASIPAGLTTIDALTSENGFTEEKTEEILTKWKNGLIFGGFGTYVSGPLGNVIQNIIKTKPNLITNLVKQVFSNKGLTAVAKTGGVSAEITADVMFDMLLQNGDIVSSLEMNSGMNIAMMLIGGRFAKGADNNIKSDISIQKNNDGSFFIKNKEGKLIFKANDENVLVTYLLGKAIDDATAHQRVAGDADATMPNPSQLASQKLQDKVGLKLDESRLGQTFPQAPLRYNRPSDNYLDVLKHFDPEVMAQHYEIIAQKIDDCIKKHANELSTLGRNFEMNKQHFANKIIDILAKEFKLEGLKPEIQLTKFPDNDGNDGYWDWTLAKIIIDENISNPKDLVKIISHEFQHVLQYRDVVTRHGVEGLRRLCANSSNPAKEFEDVMNNPYTQKLLDYAKSNPHAKDGLAQYMSEIYTDEMSNYKNSDHPDYQKQVMEQEPYYLGNNRTQNAWEQHVESGNRANDNALAKLRQKLKNQLLNGETPIQKPDTPTPTQTPNNYSIDEYGQIHNNNKPAGRRALEPMHPRKFAQHYGIALGKINQYIDKYGFVLDKDGNIDPHNDTNKKALLKLKRDQQKLQNDTQPQPPTADTPAPKPEAPRGEATEAPKTNEPEAETIRASKNKETKDETQTTETQTVPEVSTTKTEETEPTKEKRFKSSAQNTNPNIYGITDFAKKAGVTPATVYAYANKGLVVRLKNGGIDITDPINIKFLNGRINKKQTQTTQAKPVEENSPLKDKLIEILSHENYVVSKGLMKDGVEFLEDYICRIIDNKIDTTKLSIDEYISLTNLCKKIITERINNKSLPKDFSDIEIKRQKKPIDISDILAKENPDRMTPAQAKNISELKTYLEHNDLYPELTSELGFPRPDEITNKNIAQAQFLKDIYEHHSQNADLAGIEKVFETLKKKFPDKIDLLAQMYTNSSAKIDIIDALKDINKTKMLIDKLEVFKEWHGGLGKELKLTAQEYEFMRMEMNLALEHITKDGTNIFEVLKCKDFKELANYAEKIPDGKLDVIFQMFGQKDVSALKQYLEDNMIKDFTIKKSVVKTWKSALDKKSRANYSMTIYFKENRNKSIKENFEMICKLYENTNDKITLKEYEKPEQLAVTGMNILDELRTQIKMASNKNALVTDGYYKNILNFLGIKTEGVSAKDIVAQTRNLSKEQFIKLNTLTQALKSSAFDDIITNLHCKMRFIERFLPKIDEKTLEPEHFASIIDYFKGEINKSLNQKMEIRTYQSGNEGNIIISPKLELPVLKQTFTMGLNNNHKLHTIYGNYSLR